MRSPVLCPWGGKGLRLSTCCGLDPALTKQFRSFLPSSYSPTTSLNKGPCIPLLFKERGKTVKRNIRRIGNVFFESNGEDWLWMVWCHSAGGGRNHFFWRCRREDRNFFFCKLINWLCLKTQSSGPVKLLTKGGQPRGPETCWSFVFFYVLFSSQGT